MRPHDCPDQERGDYCAICERAISAAEDARNEHDPGMSDLLADQHERFLARGLEGNGTC